MTSRFFPRMAPGDEISVERVGDVIKLGAGGSHNDWSITDLSLEEAAQLVLLLRDAIRG